MKFSVVLLAAVLSCFPLWSFAADDDAAADAGISAGMGADISADAAVKQAIVEKLSTLIANAEQDIEQVNKTEIPGLYAVEFRNGQVMYSGAGGEFVIDGTLYQVTEQGAVDLRKVRLKPVRAKAMAAIPTEQLVTFAPQGETKVVVYSFTDVDCGYCRKMHREMADYNKLGIEVRYLAYPRAGVGSSSYKKMVSIWCADNRQQAMTESKAGRSIPMKSCENPVAEQFALGSRLGVTGTPSLITEDGDMLPGYMPAARLAAALGL